MNIAHTLIRSGRRTLQIEINHKAELVIRAPSRMSKRRIFHFLEEKEEWIQKTITKMHLKKKELSVPENTFLFLGKHTSIRMRIQKKSIEWCDDVLFFSPKAWEEKEASFEKFAREYLRRMAQEYALVYAEEIGMTYSSIRIGSAKTRWGSCTSKGNLSFSWRLLSAPEEVVKYVIAHEVAHLKEMNHSKRFWAIVEKLCPDYKEQKKWLRENGHALIQ